MFDLATAKKRLGISDATQDADITLTLDTALGIAEAYCDRKFNKQAWKEEITLKTGAVLSLERYPLDPAQPITLTGKGNANFGQLKDIDHERGIVYLNSFYSDIVTANYTGGFNTLPADLEAALWLVFDNTHYDLHTASVQSGGGGSEIKQVSLSGVASVTFFDPARGSGAVTTSKGVGAIPQQIGGAAGTLNLYMRERA